MYIIYSSIKCLNTLPLQMQIKKQLTEHALPKTTLKLNFDFSKRSFIDKKILPN